MKPLSPEQVIERFFSRVHFIPEAGCWLIEGPTYGQGYVYFMKERAHRWAYEKWKGEIPAGLVVRHACDVPSCVNPGHLILGSQVENIRDKVMRGRQAKGERMFASKLTESQVKEIRIRLARPNRGYSSLGREYGVDRKVISRIHRMQAWKHVGSPVRPEDC
jgi:hypothetical protein